MNHGTTAIHLRYLCRRQIVATHKLLNPRSTYLLSSKTNTYSSITMCDKLRRAFRRMGRLCSRLRKSMPNRFDLPHEIILLIHAQPDLTSRMALSLTCRNLWHICPPPETHFCRNVICCGWEPYSEMTCQTCSFVPTVHLHRLGFTVCEHTSVKTCQRKHRAALLGAMRSNLQAMHNLFDRLYG